MRIYSTDDKDELYEISYSRSSGGWAPLLHSVSTTTNPGAFSTPGRNGTPLSAVAAVIVDDSWVTKVYFHPRRIIGEWDLCTKVATYNGIPKYSQGAFERRQVEEETRVKIREDEERKAREEAERQAREEAERIAREEAERKAKEEEEARKASELPNTVVSASCFRLTRCDGDLLSIRPSPTLSRLSAACKGPPSRLMTGTTSLNPSSPSQCTGTAARRSTLQIMA